MCINEGGLRRTVYLRIFWRERRPSAGIFVYEMDTLVYIHIDVYIYILCYEFCCCAWFEP